MRPFTGILLAALCLPAGALPAQAIPDRDNTNPTGWLWYYGQSAAQITAIINANGVRLVDLEVETTSPLTFSAAFVANTGTYATGWWWLTSVDASTLSTFLNNNAARIIDLEAFEVGSALRFAAIMVPNTGANAKTWWWYFGQSVSGIVNHLSQNGARPVDIEQYTLGSTTYYAVVMIRNTGADAKTYWHYYGVSPSFIAQHIDDTGARLVDFERSGSGTYNFISVRDNAGKWWWYYGISLQRAIDIIGNTGSRVVSFERVGSTFNLLLLNNSNALSTRVSAAMRSATDGVVGCYLKRVNGGVLAWIHGDRVFEPASLMKTLHHVHAMRQVQLGNVALTRQISYGTTRQGCSFVGPFITESLETILGKMMQQSDNAATEAVRLFFGMSNINATADALQMPDTELRHVLGCGTPPNDLTLRDIGRLHEQVSNGYLGSQRDKFIQLMVNSPRSYAGLGTVLDEEAAAVGLSASQKAAFEAAMEVAVKGGYYPFTGDYVSSWGGYVSLPFYDNGGIVMRAYVTGAFVNHASVSEEATAASGAGAREVLRDEIRAAMVTWRDHAFGSLTAFGLACPGTAGTPVHSATGTPEIGETLRYALAGARPSTAIALHVGDSRTSWNGLGLPFNLALLGAPNCFLNTGPVMSIGSTTLADGTRSIPIRLPLDERLIGATFHTQFVVVDPGANAGALVTTRGVTTVLGGQH
jgi:hypothetical protein